MALVGLRVALIGLLVACAAPADDASAGGDEFDEKSYRASLEFFETQRVELRRAFDDATSEKGRAKVRSKARDAMLASLDEVIFPAWMGTPWSMGPSSTASVPHQEGKTVGCSYFVTGALMNAGLRFDSRSRFAQAAALYIQRSLAPAEPQLHRYLSIPAPDMAEKVAKLGDGLYLIGLRNHIGFVRVASGEATFIHSGPTGPSAVQSEPLAEAPSVIASRPSGYFVTPVLVAGDEDGDRLIEYWLRGRDVPFQRLGYP